MIRIILLSSPLIKLHTLRQHASLNTNIRVFRYGVQEKPLDPTLMQNHLLEPRDPGNGVWDFVAALDDAVGVGVPEVDLEHVV